MKKKYIATFAVVGLAIMAMGGLPGLDDEGNPLTPATSIGAIDGSQTDIANLGDLIAPGYQAVSNAAVSAIDASYISPTNSEFVTAVTNCPVLVNPDDASELGEYGTYGTIGAAIMGLLAAVAALKKKIAYGIKSLFSATDSLNREQSALTVTWKDTVTYDNRAAADSIFFKPSVFGMPNGAYISSCTITTTDTGSYLSSNPICIKLVDVSSSAILAVSNLVVADATNTEYTFYLNSRVALADNTKQYAFEFFNDVGQDATLTWIGLRLKVMSGATDLYFGASHQTWRPAITVNWSNETVKSAIEGKMGPYDFADANVSSTLTDSAYPVRLAPFTNNRFNVATPSTSSPYSISVDPVASAYGSDKMRDLWFFVDCTNLTESAIPTLQWDANVFKPTGGDDDQLALVPEKPNVFMISEYESGKFLVARETFEGGGGTAGVSDVTVNGTSVVNTTTGVAALGAAAGLNVGTTSGTVAAGDDSRITSAVPNTRKVNNKALSSNITLNASDVGAESSSNKVTSISSSSTDTQYPSAKCVWNALSNADSRYSLNPSWNPISPPGGNTISYLGVQSSAQALNVVDVGSFQNGKVLDFIIDIENKFKPGDLPETATISFGDLGTNWYAVVNEGEDLSDMTTLAAGEKARFYFTQTAFTKNGLPVMQIVKQVIEDASSGGGGSYEIETDGTVTTEGEPNSDGTLSVEGELNADGTLTVEAT